MKIITLSQFNKVNFKNYIDLYNEWIALELLAYYRSWTINEYFRSKRPIVIRAFWLSVKKTYCFRLMPKILEKGGWKQQNTKKTYEFDTRLDIVYIETFKIYSKFHSKLLSTSGLWAMKIVFGSFYHNVKLNPRMLFNSYLQLGT